MGEDISELIKMHGDRIDFTLLSEAQIEFLSHPEVLRRALNNPQRSSDRWDFMRIKGIESLEEGVILQCLDMVETNECFDYHAKHESYKRITGDDKAELKGVPWGESRPYTTYTLRDGSKVKMDFDFDYYVR